jgi:hypothetical protein
MPIVIDTNFTTNAVLSLEDFLNTNVLAAYNAAVVGTQYPNACTVILADPDDYSVVTKTPVIVLREPTAGPYADWGMGDHVGFSYLDFEMEWYPSQATDPTTGIQRPARLSMTALRSLAVNLGTGLTIPMLDFNDGKNPIETMFVVSCRVTDRRGAVALLALDKWRFNVDLRVRIPVISLNG